uniref:Integrator complex subunit 5 n=1 Tax=Cairina moschata TaxID=8855 RepID=A0A8C3CJ55_CAIMO
ELLGQLSSRYAGRHGARGLNELLQLWTGCEATRTLLELYGQCFGALLGSCPDACVAALLDTSLQHSPHFDWVVAHVGGAFPGTIISRVLACGLKDYCAHLEAPGGVTGGTGGGAAAASSSPSGPGGAPKLASVVGILGHLASRHGASIRQELLRLFHASLAPGGGARGGVGFLLQLALLSPPLLGAVWGELVAALTPPVLAQLHQRFAPLPREELEGLGGVLVRLLGQTSAGAPRTLRFLLDTAAPPPRLGIRPPACERLLALLLLHLQKLVHGRGGPGPGDPPARPIPFLEALRGRERDLCLEALRLEPKRSLWLHQLLGLLAVYAAPHGPPEALFHLLALATSPQQLALATQLHAVLAPSLADLPAAAAAACVRRIHAGALPPPQLARLLRNLSFLVAATTPEDPLGRRLGTELGQNLPELAQLLLHSDGDVAGAAALLLCALPAPRSLRPAQLHAVLRAAVHHLFLLLRLPTDFGDPPGPPRTAGTTTQASSLAHGARLLERLCATSPSAARAALQLLVEAALRGGNAELFGAFAPPGDPPEEPPEPPKTSCQASLLDANRRFAAAVDFPGGVCSVFHAGVIGEGLKTPPGPPRHPQHRISRNAQTFLGVLLRCCRAADPDSPPGTLGCEGPQAVAAALVEAVCPWAAGGDPNWPPQDEPGRGSLERDLGVLRRFRQHPLLFPLLRVVAAGRPPVLARCWPVLRGLLATLVAHWDACREPSASSSPWHLRASCALVGCLAEGAMLPPVLGKAQELFPRLAPFEVKLLLLSLWGYLREQGGGQGNPRGVPPRAPQRRGLGREGELGDPGGCLAALHSVLHRNVGSLGVLAGRFRT